MSQPTRPSADDYVGGWTPLPLWPRLNEPVPDDATFITSPSVPPGSTFVVDLAPIGAPIAGLPEDAAQPHTLVVRLDGTACTSAVVTLVDTVGGADRWIKSQSYDLQPGFRDYELTLSYQEAAGIEDYSALKLMVMVTGGGSSCSSSSSSSGSSRSSSSSSSGSSHSSSSGSSRSSSSASSRSSSSGSSSSGSSSGSAPTCAGVSSTLTFTMSPTGCGIPSGLPLTNPGNGTWAGGASAGCSSTGGFMVTITCTNGAWSYTVADGPVAMGPFVPQSLSPFHGEFSFVGMNCCSGVTMLCTITE